VPGTIHCDFHGEAERTQVCVHVAGNGAGLGFNREEASEDNPFPDAWCDDCEIICAAHDGWTDEARSLTQVVLLCSECYEYARIRNTHPAVTLDDLSGMRWQCSDCDEWHTGPCLDFGVSEPFYWGKDHAKASRWANLVPRPYRSLARTFLDYDFCSIDGQSFFVRGLIHLPIVGTAQTFRWGVWGSLSRENFEILLKADGKQKNSHLPPMFSWLSSQLPEYPDTLNLKMHTYIQEPDLRPQFELEPSDHPLAQEFHHGILPERVREIMLRRLPAAEA